MVGAALVHHQRNEDNVCLSILDRALTNLRAFERVREDQRSFLSIHIESLRTDIQAMIEEGKVRDIKLKHAEF